MAKVTIIVPVYNVSKYLIRCLDSLSNQSLNDLEIICINDGSTDESLKILKDYASKDNRFVVISQKNQGTGTARNNGIKLATGEYLMFVDPDDWIERHAVEQLYQQAKLLKSKVLQFNHKEYDDHSKKFKNINFAKHIKQCYGYDLKITPYFNSQILKNNCFHQLDLHACTKFYSRKFINQTKAKFAPTKHGEDHLFVNIVLLNAKRIDYLDQYLYVYCLRAGSATHTVSNNFDIFKNIKIFKKYLIENHFWKEYTNEFNSYKIQVIVWHHKFILPNSIQKYRSLAKEILTPNQYKIMIKQTQIKQKWLKWIFSITNEYINNKKYRTIIIIGIKFRIRQV